MVRELFPNIFQIKVPLPHNPLGHLNSYLVTSGEKNLLIDTGLNLPQAFHSLSRGLSEAGVKLEDLTEVLLTHFHVDHVGLIPRVKEASKNVKISIHQIEAKLSEMIAEKSLDYKGNVETFLEANGAPSSIAQNLRRFHPAFFAPEAYQVLAMSAFPLEHGQELSVGDYNFQVIWTPGHSPGHICLYEPSLKVLISGDHLLPTITPHVAQFMEEMDPLRDYLESLEKTGNIEVEVVLPAHEEVFTDHYERIQQLREHHKRRLKEVLFELKAGSLTAYMLASRVQWNVKHKSWDEFPLFQKYLALGETLAHLKVLEQKGRVKRTELNQLIFYDVTEKIRDEHD